MTEVLEWPTLCEEWASGGLDYSEQKQDEDDEQDEADAAAAVVAESWTQPIATKAEHQNQDNQKDKHVCFSKVMKFRWYG